MYYSYSSYFLFVTIYLVRGTRVSDVLPPSLNSYKWQKHSVCSAIAILCSPLNFEIHLSNENVLHSKYAYKYKMVRN